jgi:hypothetical protein
MVGEPDRRRPECAASSSSSACTPVARQALAKTIHSIPRIISGLEAQVEALTLVLLVLVGAAQELLEPLCVCQMEEPFGHLLDTDMQAGAVHTSGLLLPWNVQVNSRTHVPQKLSGLVVYSLYINPVSILSVLYNLFKPY